MLLSSPGIEEEPTDSNADAFFSLPTEQGSFTLEMADPVDTRIPFRLLLLQTTVESIRTSSVGPTDNGTGPDIGSTNGTESGPGLLAAGFITTLFLVLVLTTVIGNVLVCLAVFLVRKLHRPENYLLVSLAIVDFCVGTLVMPLAYAYLVLGKWTLGTAVCNLWTSVDVTLCTASILNLCAISVDRYCAIVRPLTYAAWQRTTRRMTFYIAGVWILALLISVVPLFAFHRTVEKGKCQVSQNIYYQIYATLGSFYVPTMIMVTVNFKIVKAARRLAHSENRNSSVQYNAHAAVNDAVAPESPGRHRKSQDQDPDSRRGSKKARVPSIQLPLIRRVTRAFDLGVHRDSAASQNESFFRGEGKALKTLGIIMGAFITCWLPFFIVALIKPLCGKHCTIPQWLDHMVLWLGYFNSTLNPLIYAKYNRDFRIPFREMLCCRFGTLQSVLRSAQFREKFGAPSPTRPPVAAIVHENHTVTLSNTNHVQNSCPHVLEIVS